MGCLCPREAVAKEELKKGRHSHAQLSAVGDRDGGRRDHPRAGGILEVLSKRSCGSYNARKETARKGSKETVCNMRVRKKLHSGP